jgi:hypothetical protein
MEHRTCLTSTVEGMEGVEGLERGPGSTVEDMGEMEGMGSLRRGWATHVGPRAKPAAGRTAGRVGVSLSAHQDSWHGIHSAN